MTPPLLKRQTAPESGVLVFPGRVNASAVVSQSRVLT
jgi:hypothetical protein